MPSSTDTSLSTQDSTSPKSTGSPSSSTQSICSPSGSEKSSHSSAGEPVSSPDSESKREKKLKRTSYTNAQLQSLLKIFHENPYPDSEMMETISLDLGVPENKIKVWYIYIYICFLMRLLINLFRLIVLPESKINVVQGFARKYPYTIIIL